MWYIYTMEYYSAIKRNEIRSFVEKWMDLETVIQSEVRQKEIGRAHVWTPVTQWSRMPSSAWKKKRKKRKKKTSEVLARMWRNWNPCTVGGNVNWYSHYGEQYGGSLKTKSRITIWSSNPTTGHISRENHNSKRHMHPNVHYVLFTIARSWKQPKCPSTDE